MITRIFSSLQTFKELHFCSGLNVLIARKELGASTRQTRNRAGKTSLIEIIHLLLGANVGPKSLFRSEALTGVSFGMDFCLAGDPLRVERSGALRSRVSVKNLRTGQDFSYGNTEWKSFLGDKMFGLGQLPEGVGWKPSYRSLFSYFVRRQLAGAFMTPERHSTEQQRSDWQTTLMFLLGLDWAIASEWQQVREQEKSLTHLRKIGRTGVLDEMVGKTSDLRTQVAVAEAKLKNRKDELSSFQLLPQYRELELEADELTRDLAELANANAIDLAAIGDLERSLQAEAPPPPEDLRRLYEEAGVVLPGLALKRYEDVQSFHESVIRNRRDYLTGELEALRQRVDKREQQQLRMDERRAAILTALDGHGALDQFAKLQAEVSRLEAQVEALRQRFQTAEQLESKKGELDIKRRHLTLRLQRDFAEQTKRLTEAILAFEETSERLYESAGSMVVKETANGPAFEFLMQGSRSKGITNMQIFCFDMMLMRLSARRGLGPGFLVHDSHLFDGVDGRQVVTALKVGAETAEQFGFQYIVTMNEDDAFKERIPGFDVKDHVLPVVITDATEDGGLFGIRF
jgi:uncharacterized protein YydD (DUF2326 family)